MGLGLTGKLGRAWVGAWVHRGGGGDNDTAACQNNPGLFYRSFLYLSYYAIVSPCSELVDYTQLNLQCKLFVIGVLD